MFHGLDVLRQHIREDARIHGIIVKSGEALNVIPDYAEVIITIRAVDLDYLNQLKEEIIYEKSAEVVENLMAFGFKLVDPIELIKF